VRHIFSPIRANIVSAPPHFFYYFIKTEMIKTLSLVFIFALSILFGFIVGFAILGKTSPAGSPLCVSVEGGELKDGDSCKH